MAKVKKTTDQEVDKWITVKGKHVPIGKDGKIIDTSKKSEGGKKEDKTRKASESKKTYKIDGKGAPTSKDLGFSEEKVKDLINAEAKKHGKNSWDVLSADREKIVDKYVKDNKLPTHIKSDNVDIKIDHYDYAGGIFSYNGTAMGFTVGKQYKDPNNKGSKTLYEVKSIHVYPNGKIEVNSSSVNDFIRHNRTLYSGRGND